MSMPNETKHTPGPWRVDGAYIGTEQFGIVAKLWSYAGMDWEKDNADLIARAPTLLAENESLRQQNAELVRALTHSREYIVAVTSQSDRDRHPQSFGLLDRVDAILATVQS